MTTRDAIAQMLMQKFGLETHIAYKVVDLGVEQESDLTYLREEDLVAISVPVIKARRIVEAYAVKPKSSDTEVFATLLSLDMSTDNGQFMTFFTQHGEAFVHEALWLNPANDVSKIDMEILFMIRALIGRDPFTEAVVQRLLIGRTEEDDRTGIRLFGKDNDEMLEGIKQLAASHGPLKAEDQDSIALLRSLFGMGDILRLSWKK